MEIIAMVLVILVLVGFQTHLFRKHVFEHLEYRCYFSKDEAVEGEEIELVEEISNRKLLPIPWLKAEITSSKWLDFAGTQSVVTDVTRFVASFFMLKSYNKITRRWKVKCLKRGVFSVEKVVLVSTDILGQETLSQSANATATVTVLPLAADLPREFVSPRYLQGDTVVRRQLVDDPFYVAGVREYRAGDPLNRINWSATARSQELMVRNFDYTSRQNLGVLLNMQSSEFENHEIIDTDTIEYNIKVAAAVFESARDEGIPVSLLSNGTVDVRRNTVFMEQSWGSEHCMNLLRQLSHLQLSSTEDFAAYLEQNHSRSDATDLVLITAYLSEPICDFARERERSGIHVKIYLTADKGFALPPDLDIYTAFRPLADEEGIA